MTRLAVAVPTRNRADLAKAAVRSVLREAHPDITVVVSDNSTDDGDREELAEFCAQQAPGRVEYVRPPQPLEMAAHWEWVRRVVQSRGAHTHLTYLTDRMVFLAGALAELVEIVARHPERVLSYHHDRVEDRALPAELVQTQWTGRLLELDACRLIDLSRRGMWGDYLPRMLNSIVPLSVLTAIEDRFGSVFAPVSPDYRFAYRCLATCDAVLYLDRACLIERGMTRSAGISYAKGKSNRDAADFQLALSTPLFSATPEPAFATVANAIYDEYFAVRRETGGSRFPAVDRRSYLAANAASVDRIEDPAWKLRMQEILSRHGWTRRDRARETIDLALMMAGYFIRHPAAFARSAKRQLLDRPPGTPLALLLPRIGIDPRLRDELRFQSSAEAITHAEAHPRPRTASAWHTHRLRQAGAIIRIVPRE
ncbi:MAG TPA: glycosyltransferase [Thermoleophilaceae bacterium]